jgi:hypothetical protein
MSAIIPACVDCNLMFPSIRGGSKLCGRFGERFSAVDGPTASLSTCESERWRFWRWLGCNTCGPEGRYFEPKQPLKPPTGGSAVMRPTR